MSVTGPAGFRAAGIAAGIKENGNRDLALVVNDGPNQAAAGVFEGLAKDARWQDYADRLIAARKSA